nr:hypothetical protein [Kofleriaceae bacterium]
MKRLVIALVLVMCGVAEAHKPSDAHLRIAVSGSQLAGQISIALRDLDGALALDVDGNGDITWAETTAATARIDKYVIDRVHLADGDDACPIALGPPALVDLTDGAYWTAAVTADCPARPSELVVTYALMFDIDAQHRGIVHLEAPGMAKTVVVRSSKPVSIAIADPTAFTTVAGAGARDLSPWPLAALLALLVAAARARRTRPRQLADIVAAFALAELAGCALVTAGDLVLPWGYVEPALAALAVIAAGAAVLRRSGGALPLELGFAFGFSLAHGLDALALPAHGLGTVAAFAAGALAVQVAAAAVVAVLVARRYRAPAAPAPTTP